MKISKTDKELFELIDLATSGNKKAKWKIIWIFNDLLIKSSSIDSMYDENCYEYVEKAVFDSIEKFNTLRKIKKFKKI